MMVMMLNCAVSWAADGTSPLRVTHENRIVAIYIGDVQPDGKTELVFELVGMSFASSGKSCSCIMVNGQIGWIKEYNVADSYVRAHVALGDAAELTVYCGTLEHPEKIDPHDHAALWKGFVASSRKPFVARPADLPKWFVVNPIRQKRLEGKHVPVPREDTLRIALADYTRDLRLTKEDVPFVAGEAVQGNFQAVRALAVSPHTPESVEALCTVLAAEGMSEGCITYAAMGLRNFISSLSQQEKDRASELCGQQLLARKAKTDTGCIQLLLDLGGAELIRRTMGPELAGAPWEIEVLTKVRGGPAAARLWEIVQAHAAMQTEADAAFVERAGRALVERGDERGIDALAMLLPRGKAPNQQRSNAFNFLIRHLRNDFAYTSANYDPSLEEAVPKFLQWWKANHESYRFPRGGLQ
jgi:hypothetical protein